MVSRRSRARRRARRRDDDALTLEVSEARRLIRDPEQDAIVHVAAANTLLEECRDPTKVSLEDLLECVRRGHVAAEMGAYALNLRLGRRSEDEITPEDSITDIDFWLRYIDESG